MKKYLGFVAIIGLVLAGSLFYWFEYLPNKMQVDFDKYIASFILAINQSDCSQLYPINKIGNANRDVLCPRGDVGNFMVIDKVTYSIKNVLDGDSLHSKQALIDICIDARGNAAWNEGNYSECKTDASVVNFSYKNSSWVVEVKDFTNISELMKKAGEKAGNYQCIGSSCFPNSQGIVDYAIKMHSFPRQGVAH